ncbi:MAG TPA: TonB-dependent receptor [Terriglobales bacterium]
MTLLQRFRISLPLSLVVFFCSLSALAQTGSISGTVSDQAGAVISGAQVTVVNAGTGLTRTTTTSDSGTFNLTELPAGMYEVAVSKDGFKAFKVTNAQVTVAQALTVNPKLEPGVVTEVIQVNGEQLPDVVLDDAQVSNLVDKKQIEGLPLITRNPYELVLLSPGTQQTNSRLGGISVNGQRERNNNFLLDGVDNNDTSVPGGLTSVLGPNPESVQEFRVITDNFNAEYGRNTGAIVDVITSSGTNAFHGKAYEFGRWNGFGGARDWFNTKDQPQDPYIRHQFGYSIGGPIIKNKTFFFVNEEFDRFITALTNVAVVPTAAFKTGQFIYTDETGTQTPVDISDPASPQNTFGLPIDPTALKILNQFPTAPSSTNGFDGLLFYPSTSRTKSYQAVAKIDHQITDKHFLSVRYGYDPFSDPNPFHDDVLPGNLGASSSSGVSQAASLNLTSTFNSRLINSFSVGWNQIRVGFGCTGLSVLDQVSAQEGTLDQFGYGRDYGMAPFSTFGCAGLVANSEGRKTGTTSYGDSLSLVRGGHTFKFGGDFHNVHELGDTNFFARRQVGLDLFDWFGTPAQLGFGLIGGVPGDPTCGSGTYCDLQNAASALFGLVGHDLDAQFFDHTGNRVATNLRDFIQHEFSFYGQDTWKLRPNLTLTLGVRYQRNGVPYEKNGNLSNLFIDPTTLASGEDAVFSTVGPGTGRQLYNNDNSNIEPRVGFSWDPWSDGKTAIRGSFGIFHDRAFGNLFGNARGNPPFEVDYTNFPGDSLNNVFDSFEFLPVAPAQLSSPNVADGTLLDTVVYFDRHFRNPVSNSWNFGIQRELASNLTLDLTYIGSQAHHVFRAIDGNSPDPALVQGLVDICSSSDPSINTTNCTPDDVSGIFLYEGAEFGVLPSNAVANNALLQPALNMSNADAYYNGLQVKVTHRMKHGLYIQGAYTWSHASDNANDPIDPASNNRSFPRNSRNPNADYGNSDNDIRHIAAINYDYELPFGKGRAFLNSGAAGKILGGMSLQGITTIQTGHPFDLFSSVDSQRTGVSQRADLVGDPFAPGSNDTNGPNNGAKVWFRNPDAFAAPEINGLPGTTGKNQFYGPGFVNFDMVWAKDMTFRDRIGAQLRVECFNIFNHPHFVQPTSSVPSSFLGLITGTASRSDGTTSARQFQVALKVSF